MMAPDDCPPAENLIIAIPAYKGINHIELTWGLFGVQLALHQHGIKSDLIYMRHNWSIPDARNTLAHLFLKQTAATDLLFLDYDVGCSTDAIVKMALARRPVVTAFYRIKRPDNELQWAGRLKNPFRLEFENGLIKGAEVGPCGFMRINRSVFEVLRPHCATYTNDVGEVTQFFRSGPRDGQIYTEDAEFCAQWQSLGGEIYVLPDVTLTHSGNFTWTGNFYEWLQQQREKLKVA